MGRKSLFLLVIVTILVLAGAMPLESDYSATSLYNGAHMNGADRPISSSEQPHHALGCLYEDPLVSGVFKPSPYTERSRSSEIPEAPHPGEPPEAVFNTVGLPPIGDQGQQGSCTAWATGYYCMTHQIAKANDWWDTTIASHQFSPAFVYNQINFGDDSGSYVSDAIELMKDFGCATMADMPYDYTDYTSWPSEWAYTNAINYRVSESYYIYTLNDNGIEAVKQALLDGNVLVTAIYVKTSFFYFDETNNVYSTTYADETTYGGHAVCIVGYDDTITTDDGAGAFLLVNSWGTNWGDGGFWWMTYEAMKNPALSRGYAYHFDVVEQPHSPKLIATFRISHEHRGQIMYDGLQISVGTQSYTAWTNTYWAFAIRSADGNYQNHPFPGNEIVIDISDAVPYLRSTLTNYIHLTIGDSIWPLDGVLEHFHVWYSDWHVGAQCFETPVTVPDSGGQVTVTIALECPRVEMAYIPPSVGGVEYVEGSATGYSRETVLDVGFESGSTGGTWTTFDDNPSGGYNYWSITSYRSKSGGSSLWCGGTPSSVAVYTEHFDMAVWLGWPAGWSVYSRWVPVGTSGSYAIYCDTGGASVVQWAVQGPLDLSSATELYLTFWMKYQVEDAHSSDAFHVLYSTDGTIFYFLKSWSPSAGETACYSGNQQIRLPDAAIDSTFYLAFIFEGSERGNVTVDNIDIWDVDLRYPNYSDSYVSRPVDLTSYDSAYLAFDYWSDVESGFDWFAPAYYNSEGWHILGKIGSSAGWQRHEVFVPTDAQFVGFYFHSDSVIAKEGVYIDNVILTGINYGSTVGIEIDRTPVGYASGYSSWIYAWNTTAYMDGYHEITAYFTLAGVKYSDSQIVFVDNTAPLLISSTERYQTGSEITISGYANTLGGSLLASLYLCGGNGSTYFPDYPVGGYLNSTTITWLFSNSSVIHDGAYRVQLNLTDQAGNYDLLWIDFVVDSSPPSIVGPSDRQISEGSTGERLVWTCLDANPGSYQIWVNDELQQEGQWTDLVTLALDSFTLGKHNVTLVVHDAVGLTARDIVFVTVSDDTAPTVSHPSDITFIESTTGHTLTWLGEDAHPDKFEIYHNGSLYVSATWRDTVCLRLDELGPGTHNLTIVLYDTSGNWVRDSVMVTVIAEQTTITTTTTTTESTTTTGTSSTSTPATTTSSTTSSPSTPTTTSSTSTPLIGNSSLILTVGIAAVAAAAGVMTTLVVLKLRRRT